MFLDRECVLQKKHHAKPKLRVTNVCKRTARHLILHAEQVTKINHMKVQRLSRSDQLHLSSIYAAETQLHLLHILQHRGERTKILERGSI